MFRLLKVKPDVFSNSTGFLFFLFSNRVNINTIETGIYLVSTWKTKVFDGVVKNRYRTPKEHCVRNGGAIADLNLGPANYSSATVLALL